MKRKELYEFIREGIIEELSLVEKLYREKPGSDPQNKNPDIVSTNDKSQLAMDPQFKSKYEPVSESDLEEDLKANKIRLGDTAKIALAKELYGPETIEGRLIAAIEGSEGGLTQKELETALGISSLNLYILKLVNVKVLAKPAKTTATEPEPTVEPETDEELPTLDSDEEPVDDYEKPEEEESVPEEPSAKDIKGDLTAKKLGTKKEKLAQLQKELNSISDTLEKGKEKTLEISKKIKAKEKIDEKERAHLDKMKDLTSKKKEIEASINKEKEIED